MIRKNSEREKYHSDPEYRERILARAARYRATRLAERIRTEPGFHEDRMRKSREYYRAARSTPDGWLRAHLNQVRRRCAKNGIPFDVSSDDIETPAICPILQKKILYSGGLGLHAMAPSIDRLVPSMGYVKGNCRIISMRANTMKNDCIDPLVFERLADYVRPIN